MNNDQLPISSSSRSRPVKPVAHSIISIIAVLLSFILFLTPPCHCKVFDKCDLAGRLRDRLHVNDTREIATWVCIAQHQSGLNSAAVGAGGYYGLYQISAEFWCDEWRGANKACALMCNQLIDEDLQDDYGCMRVIYEEHKRISGDGFNAWTSYQRECSNGRAIGYIDGCFDGDHSNSLVVNDHDQWREKKPKKKWWTSEDDHGDNSQRKQNKWHNDALSNANNHDHHRSQVTAAGWQRSQSRPARIYERCELAKELVRRHSVPREQVAMWVCIAQHESNFNTSAVGTLNADGSGDHGLFQISDIYWCSPPGKGWACGLSCDKLEDEDIADDVQCMMKIYEEHQRLSGDGFNAWTVYPLYCKDRAEKYIDGCVIDEEQQKENEVFPRPGIIAPLPEDRPYDSTRTGEIKKAKMYDRCSLARELVYQHSVDRDQVATWVCIAQHESNFNTSAVGRLNADGSEDHGLFQISDIYWCSPPGKGWACGLSCDKLEDEDITDDVQCMKRIYKEHQEISGNGFNAWTVYQAYCSGDNEHLMSGCFHDQLETSSHKPGVWQPEEPQGNELEEKEDSAVGKVYSACELANELMAEHGMTRSEVAMWVCIAQHESNFNTSAVGRLNADGSEDHGLFQISDLYWCDDKPSGCGVTCAQLRDADIVDDVRCVRKIYEEHQRLFGDGFSAWSVYNLHCKGRAEGYVGGCDLKAAGGGGERENEITIDKYPFFYSRFNPQESGKRVTTTTSTTTRRPFVAWTGFTQQSTTRKPFEWKTTTTTTRPTFTYPTRAAVTTTTKKVEFLTKKPWIPQSYTTTMGTTKRPAAVTNPITKTENKERDKVDFSLYDFFLKGFKYPETTTRGKVGETTIGTTTTTTPRSTTRARPLINSNYFDFVSTTRRTTTTSTTQRPRETFKPIFVAGTTTTERSVVKNDPAPFNIFDLYLNRQPQKKTNNFVVDENKSVKTTSTTGNPFKFYSNNRLEATTVKATTFDPFSVYKINRNAYQTRTITATENLNKFGGTKWATTTTKAPPVTTTKWRNLRSSGAYQRVAEINKKHENPSGADRQGGSAAAAGVVQVTIKPFSIDYIRQIRRPS